MEWSHEIGTPTPPIWAEFELQDLGLSLVAEPQPRDRFFFKSSLFSDIFSL